MAGGDAKSPYLQEYLCLADLPVVVLSEHRFSNALARPTQVALVGSGVVFARTILTPAAQWWPFLVSFPAVFC